MCIRDSSYISQKPKNKVKWFSQLEAGYTISIPNPDKLSLNDQYYSFRGGNFIGYKIALSVREKVRSINSKSFLATGFKLGYEQSFREIEVGVNGYSHGPVSYTHLDVYKRQVRKFSQWLRAMHPGHSGCWQP